MNEVFIGFEGIRLILCTINFFHVASSRWRKSTLLPIESAMKRTFGLLEVGKRDDLGKDDTELPIDIEEAPAVCVGRAEEDPEGRVDCWVEGEGAALAPSSKLEGYR